MKNFFILIVITSFLFIESLPAEAVEGTCSWHGGIDCSAGSDWDGSAICNDGWMDSNENYYSTKSCTQNLHYCTQEEVNNLNLKYGYGIKEKDRKVKEISDQLLSIPTNATDSQTLRNNAIEALRLQSLHSAATLEFRSSMNQWDRECYALGEIGYQKRQQEFLKEWEDLTKYSQNTPQYTCPSNLIVSGDKCVCADGYVYNGSSCITYTQNCQAQFGANSNGAKQGCYCPNGYVWNSTQTACNEIEIQTPPQQISPPQSTSPATQPVIKTKIKLPPTFTEKTSITATTSKTDTVATSSRVEEIKQKVESPKIKILSRVKSFLSKLKFW